MKVKVFVFTPIRGQANQLMELRGPIAVDTKTPSKIFLLVHVGGLVLFFFGNRGSIISHSLFVKLRSMAFFSDYNL